MEEIVIIEEVGVPGLSAFEEWKIREDLPDATWEDFMQANKGSPGGVGHVVAHINDDMELVFSIADESELDFNINNNGELIITT